MSRSDQSLAIARRGLMLVLSSPSGAGKTTLSRELLAKDDGISLSVSVTTREARPGEVDGKDYHFVSKAKFEEMKAAGEFLEWATVFDNLYGTPAAPVDAALDEGRDVLFDVDWQGAQQLMDRGEADLVRVFILPPSGATLAERLKKRAQDPPEVVARRMAEASAELSHYGEYDYVIVNRHVKQSMAELRAILTSERLRRERLIGLPDFVRGLQDDV